MHRTPTHMCPAHSWVDPSSINQSPSQSVSSQPALCIRGQNVPLATCHSIYLPQGCPHMLFLRFPLGSTLGATTIGFKICRGWNRIMTLGKWLELSEPQCLWPWKGTWNPPRGQESITHSGVCVFSMPIWLNLKVIFFFLRMRRMWR